MVIFGCISLLAREFLFLLNWLIHSLTVLNSDLPTLHTIGSFAIFSICSLFCSLLLCNTILTCQHLYVNDIHLAVTLNIVKSDSSKLNWQTMRWDFSHTSGFFIFLNWGQRERGWWISVCVPTKLLLSENHLKSIRPAEPYWASRPFCWWKKTKHCSLEKGSDSEASQTFGWFYRREAILLQHLPVVGVGD